MQVQMPYAGYMDTYRPEATNAFEPLLLVKQGNNALSWL